MRMQGVILDLGHTLMYLDSTWPEVFEQGATDLAAFVDGQELGVEGKDLAQTWLEIRSEGFVQAQETCREVTAEASMRRTWAQCGVVEPDQLLVRWTIDTFFAYEYTRWTAYPEALSVLEALSEEGLRLGLFSNATDAPFIQRLVDRFGFATWLDPVLSSAATGIRKPDPVAFDPFLGAWALPPEAIAVVGDRLEADILGAQQAGMASIWLRAREDARQEGQDASRGQPVPVAPTVTINRLAELPEALASL
ncbi:MAG: HAD family hydrolase [Anaerolineae bacterium]